MKNNKGHSNNISVIIAVIMITTFNMFFFFHFLILSNDNIVINKYGEETFNKLQSEIDYWKSKYEVLEEQKQVICNCESNDTSWWFFILGGFIVGVFTSIYTIFTFDLAKYFVRKENKKEKEASKN